MRFYLHKLGCPKNDVDGDYVAARLITGGHTPVDEPSEAEAIVINTCGFIEPAKEESVDAILTLAQYKQSHGVQKLYATGCLSQRYGHELLDDIPELDGCFGLGMLEELAAALDSVVASRSVTRTDARSLAYLDHQQRHIADDLPYAYLKLSDGCSRACSYCAIPSIRGSYRSRSVENTLREASFLAEHGKKELILVSQESTLYGFDIGYRAGIVGVLEQLENVVGLEWIRLMYLHPAQLTDALIGYLSDSNKTLPYFDLPLQHINDSILADMKRSVTRRQIEDQLDAIRTAAPNGTIRTTFIVGYPTESDKDFRELYEFVDKQEFDRLGVFPYYAEEGTASFDYGDPIAARVKAERVDELMMLQQDIALAKNNSLIGSEQTVIIDSLSDPSNGIGRTPGDCPDIDQEVRVSGTELKVGDICRVRVNQVEGYDLIGTKVEG